LCALAARVRRIPLSQSEPIKQAVGFEPEITAFRSTGLRYIGRLRALLSLDDLEFNRVALLQALISIAGDSAVMDEYIRSTVAPQEAVPLRVIEPLYRALYAFHFLLSLRFPENGTYSRG